MMRLRVQDSLFAKFYGDISSRNHLLSRAFAISASELRTDIVKPAILCNIYCGTCLIIIGIPLGTAVVDVPIVRYMTFT